MVYIHDDKVLDSAPEKVLQKKKPDEEYIASLHYNNTPPKNPDGSERTYDNKNHLLTKKQYVDQRESRKKTAINSRDTELLEQPRTALSVWVKEAKENARLKKQLIDTQDALEILKKAISILGN